MFSDRRANEVTFREETLRQVGDLAVAANRPVQHRLQTAACRGQGTVERENEHASHNEQDHACQAEIRRCRQAVSHGRSTQDRRQREHRQRQPRPDLERRGRRQRRCRLSDPDARAAQHVHRERGRRCAAAGHDLADGVPGEPG
jgi:hypothetical protein